MIISAVVMCYSFQMSCGWYAAHSWQQSSGIGVSLNRPLPKSPHMLKTILQTSLISQCLWRVINQIVSLAHITELCLQRGMKPWGITEHSGNEIRGKLALQVSHFLEIGSLIKTGKQSLWKCCLCINEVCVCVYVSVGVCMHTCTLQKCCFFA